MPDLAPLDLESYLSRFGLSEFRPGQRDVISTVISGQDCLCVMPTGGGKSLCYQLPAVARDGVVLVVSPLIALMQDQVQQLQKHDVQATFINSSLETSEQYDRLELMSTGHYDLVYVAAERFRSARFLEALSRTHVQMLAIDEAHCISEWGHDFRPDYARLGAFRRKIGNPTTIALTATATAAVRGDIARQLELNEPGTFVTGFARPNLHYSVQTHSRRRQKDAALLDFLQSAGKPGIVYASTRKRCEEVAQMLRDEAGLRAGLYHAGLEHQVRRDTQHGFMQGKFDVVVATNAFGMGIDKADVRFVVHYNMPGTLEAYYQEAGRAGRDGQRSECLLLYSPADASIQEFFIESAYPSREIVEAVYNFLRRIDSEPIELTQQEIKEQLNLPVGSEAVGTCEKLLEKAGALERLESRHNMACVRLSSDLPTLVELLPKQATTQRRVLQILERIVRGRRFEMVYFQPRDVAETAELDGASLGRALRELCKLDVLDYVPPFRGRAVRMLEHDRHFSELDIDFETLAQRKAEEYAKLKRVSDFALSRRCRQQDVLDYFGQEENPPCGHCDNCRPGGARSSAARVVDDGAVLNGVRIVLSGVARVHERFGKNMVADMLCGSKNAKVTKFRLDRLSTYGLLKFLPQREVVEMMDALINARCLEQVDLGDRRPIVKLTAEGRRVMRGEDLLPQDFVINKTLLQNLRANLGGQSSSAGSNQENAAEPTDEAHPKVLELLKRWRQETSSELAIPAYRVLTNATLRDVAVHLPGSTAALLEIKGIGPATVENFGPYILAIVEQATKASSSGEQDRQPSLLSEESSVGANGRQEVAPSEEPAEQSTTEDPIPAKLPAARPPHYWTWRLLRMGLTAAECAQARGLELPVVFDHALRSADAGWPVELSWFLSEEKSAAIGKLVGDETPERIRPLLAHLPRGTRYEEVQYYLKARGTQGAKGPD